MSKQKSNFLGYFFNTVSLVGMVLAVVATGLIISFFSFEMITGVEKPYLGLMTYFLFPGMLILGLLLIPIGAIKVRNYHRLHKDEDIPQYPRIDLNDKHKRHVFIFFIVATALFVLIVAIASIQGYEFTESTTFCGELCHVVMEPEFVAWKHSPHARVKCAECHVGPGAAWYVKAKISGLKQLYAVIFHTYPETIPTPIENLRPARDTCEQCHWPQKFYSAREKIFYHFATNEENSTRQSHLLIKIGGTPKTPNSKGIHWHINSKVYYIARDTKRFDIPYIAVNNPDGSVTEYMDTEKPMTKAEIEKSEQRHMDCLDCHNRPSHVYRSASQEVDENFIAGHIDQGLPFIKKVALEFLSKSYKTTEEAQEAIAKGIPDYYAKNYPLVAKEKATAIKDAVTHVQEIYGRNFFPRMKVSWRAYPNNIGHFYFPGCFRCHDGKHKNKEGKVISKDCNLCHAVTSQIQENIPAGTEVRNFIHPVDIGDDLYKTNCSDCHMSGTSDLTTGG